MRKKYIPIVLSTILIFTPIVGSLTSSAQDLYTGSNYEELTPIIYDDNDPTKQISKDSLRGETVPATTSNQNTTLTYNFNTFYTVVGPAVVEKNLQPQQVQYGQLDNLGRATGAWAVITDAMYEHSAGGTRYKEEYRNDPPGYISQQVPVNYNDRSYNGYFYNRSHLIGDSIGGRFFEQNLINGTRMQNVGWNTTNPTGGMRYTETLAENHFKNTDNCNLYYAAVPNYVGTEVMPRTVTVDIQNCDKSIDERVIVENTAPGYIINYNDGTFVEGDPATSGQNDVSTPPEQQTEDPTIEDNNPVLPPENPDVPPAEDQSEDIVNDDTLGSQENLSPDENMAPDENVDPSAEQNVTEDVAEEDNNTEPESSWAQDENGSYILDENGIIPENAGEEKVINIGDDTITFSRDGGNNISVTTTKADGTTTESNISLNDIAGTHAENILKDEQLKSEVIDRLLSGETINSIIDDIKSRENTNTDSTQPEGNTELHADAVGNTQSINTDGKDVGPSVNTGGVAHSFYTIFTKIFR